MLRSDHAELFTILAQIGAGYRDALFTLVGGIGLIRMPDFYTRSHAASLTDTLGAALILLDHNGYHAAQLIALRQALKVWPAC